MGYQIQYGVSRTEHRLVRKQRKIPLILSVLALIAVLATVILWPEWTKQFRQELFPLLSKEGIRAIRVFSEKLRLGEELQGAIAVFCEELLGGSVS